MYDYGATIDNILNQAIADGEIAGASLLVIKDGEEKYGKVYGEADKENHVPMKRDTIFRMYSMSKPVTAAAVMILFERGVLDVKDEIAAYLPMFCDMKVWTGDGTVIPAKRGITILDCLNMTAGVTYPSSEHEPGRRMDAVFRELIQRRENGEMIDTMEYMRRIAEVPLVFQPGEHWMYGLGADILAAVVEAASGIKYGEFLRKELFLPLGMEDTGFFVPEEKWDRFAVPYEWSEEKKSLTPLKRSHLGEYYKEDVAFESGGAGLVSTIDDYAKFAQMLLNKGKLGNVRILGEKTVEFMTRNHLTEEQAKDFNWEYLLGYDYGCLMRSLRDPARAGTNGSIGEFGWDGWTGNYMTVNPADNMVLLFFIQRCGVGYWWLTKKVRAVTYGALQDFICAK